MQERSNPLIPVAIFIAGALVAGGVLLSSMRSTDPTIVESETSSTFDFDVFTPISTDDHILGSPNARITLIEYGDLDCPACKSIHPTLTRLIDTYGKDGTVAWVYRHFPLEQLHTGTTYKAAASECVAHLAGEAAFWDFITAIFDASNETEAEIITMAETVGVPRADFQACSVAGHYLGTVEASYNEARSIGIYATPFVIISYPEGVPSAAVTQIEQAGLQLNQPGSIRVVDNNTKIILQAAFTYEVFDSIIKALLF